MMKAPTHPKIAPLSYMKGEDPRVNAWHAAKARGASHVASIRTEHATKSPSKEAHWEAFAAHNGAELAHTLAKDSKRAAYHAERKAYHLAEYRKP